MNTNGGKEINRKLLNMLSYKTGLYTWLLFILPCTLAGQFFTNSWIDYSQQYFKIKVVQDGIYRIDFNALLASNVPIGSIDPRQFQIFGKGQEQFIYIEGENDGSFDAGDYIEFYGEKNTGWLDTALYSNPGWQANTNVSLFTDTATYYLTWDSFFSIYRMTPDTNVNFSGKTPAAYFMSIVRQDYLSSYYGGNYVPAGIYVLYDQDYDIGEGWFGGAFTGIYSLPMSTPNVYSSGPNATARMALIGANLKTHNVDITIPPSITYTANYFGIQVNNLTFSIPPGNIAGTTSFNFNPTATAPDRNTVAFIEMEYPSSYNLGNASSFYLIVPDDAQGISYLNISGFNTQSSTPLLYDLTNHKRITVVTGSTFQALVPNSGGEKNCYLTSSAEAINVSVLEKAGLNGVFTDYTSMDEDSAYIIISNKSLYDGSSNWVQEYADYRANAGGNYNVVLADIDELYDQFAYGIRKHPIAIRAFCDYMINNWSTPPQYLLLLGKSISPELSRSTAGYYDYNLVPTYGFPPSDNLLTAGLAGTLYEPAIATGRIAAKTPDEVKMYLDKVKEFDNNQVLYQPDQILDKQEWKKHVLHFGGGGSLSEQMLFRQYLLGYENTITDTFYGGRVHSFFKTSSDPIQITVSDSITDLINKGVSIMCFFGHASGSGFDMNIDDPDNYFNTNGKYPLLIANACLVGDIHKPPALSNSEEWVLHPRGNIGFLASADLGEASSLNVYTSELYKNIGQKSYGQSIGKIIQETVKATQSFSNLKKTCLDMTLHGDPAVVLNTREYPDYTITYSDVFTNPPDVTSEVDSFDLNLIITNIGKAIKTDLSVEVTRKFSQAGITDSVYNISFPATYYKDTITLKLPVDKINGFGLNTFDIRIDNMNIIYELSETNNDLLHTLMIKTDDIIPVYPYRYAVVPSKQVALKASTGNPFAASKNYRFELDTTDLFISPLAYFKIIQSGGVVVWDPANDAALSAALNTAVDSTVFFWRVRWDSLNTSDSNHIWRESSFQYIDGKRGWGQDHFFQFKQDGFNLIEYNKPARSFDFITTPKLLHCTTVGNAYNSDQYSMTEYRIDGGGQIAGSCGPYDAMIIAVIDPVTLKPWRSDQNFGQVNNPYCGIYGPHNAFVFYSSPSDITFRANMATLLNNVPIGYYILAYTFTKAHFKQWEDTLYNAFQALGSAQIINIISGDTLPDNVPYAFFVKKGDLSTLQEVTGSPYDTIQLYADLITNYDFGYITSTIVGPSANWESLHWKVNSLEPFDSVRLEVSAISASGIETLIPDLSNLPPDSSDIYNLNSKIDAGIYPNLKLTVYKKDDSLKTPAQLDRWHVLYDEVPEAALNPSIYSFFLKDTLNEGESVNLSTVIENISEFDMDSLLVSFWIIDQARKIHKIPDVRYKPLLKSPDTVLTTVSFSTRGLPGINSLWVEANPYTASKNAYDQIEQYHFNNLAEKVFYVVSDRINPLVDVTFDGVHILDGDIVSAKPQIFIQLRDENKYLVLDTNSLMKVYIKQPGQSSYLDPPILYDNATLKFIPANLPENKARVEYNPIFTQDGIYELKVQAKDVSKNESGDLDYTISFEVINKPSITEVMNWPNPFSTSTRFVFTLTGADIPQDFRIRIITITGKVVREIFAGELGPLHIGKNITLYAWDGKDEFGDQLANGIYLYKVDVRLDGNTMEKRETSADKYFHKGYGKMYLMR